MAKNLALNQVGGRTLAVHGGERPDPATGASSPNIVMASTFVTESPMGFSALDLDDQSPWAYSRWDNPTVASLAEKIAALEGAETCVCFASGMGAVASTLLAGLSAGDHLLFSEVCYAGVAELTRDTLPRLGVATSAVDTSDLEAVAAAMRPETRMIFVETPANPLLRLTDIAAVAEIAHAGGARLVVDNTFATPVGTRPLTLGADVVIHAATKYLCGHGDALGGAVVGSAEAMAALRSEALVHYGAVMSPFNAWLIARGAATLPLRMKAHSETALDLARWLESHPKVARVLYPGLESHPQHTLAKRQMQAYSGMISFQVNGDAAAGAETAQRMATGLEIIHYAVSLGHHRSLVCYMGTDDLLRSSFRLTGAAEAAYRDWAGHGLFRLSVGLEDADDLRRDLDAVL